MVAASYKSLADSELVGLCLGGDALAWEFLILRYKRLIYSIAVKFRFPPSDCADVFQAVCLKLIEHLQDLKDESKVSAWLITTTTRQCLHIRSQRMRESSPQEDFVEPAAPGETVEEIQVEAQARQNVREAVDHLPERCRQLVGLLYFQAKTPTYEEISQALNIPVPSIGPTRARCLEKLRTVLRRRGIRE